MNSRPIVIDLFAGAGGLSLGFEQAGFDVVAAIEIDPIHAAVHKFNFPECQVIPKSVTKLSYKDIISYSHLNYKDKIDVVIGGAPCQGFSLIGQRALDDSRNSLVKDFLRIVNEARPSFFVFENVKGLTQGKHKIFLKEIIDKSSENGYHLISPWKVLNACNYGVPQNRERLFLIGAKKGLSLPEYPSFYKEKSPTCFDALGDLPDAEKFNTLLKKDTIKTTDFGVPSNYAEIMRCISESSWYYGYRRNWDPNLLTSSMRTNHTTISRRRFLETIPGSVEPISRFFRLSPDGISNTLRAGTDSARGAFTSPRPIHYKHARCVTVREMARLHGFPDWFRFHVTKWHGARQIGNSVPPPLARAVASEIIKALGIHPSRPSRCLELGNPYLLSVDMKNAAKYWGVENPISTRDRKSGNKKRKQTEIEKSRLSETSSLHAKTS